MPLRDIIGQPHAVERLLNARRRNRLAHGYLFVGSEGTGRERTALALAQALLCEHSVDGDACAGCGACRRVGAGSHPDLQLVLSEAEIVRRGIGKAEGSGAPSPEIRVDAVRELCRRLHLRTYEGAGRVGIVVDAHRLRVEAANALLKTLEEPAADTLLVLIAPNPRAVLDTLRSRCQIVRFAPLPVAALAELLVSQHGVDPELARAAAERAEGSLVRALELGRGDVAERVEVGRAFWSAVAGGQAGALLDLAVDLGRERERTQAHLDELSRLIHDELRQAAQRDLRSRIDALVRAYAAVLEAEAAIRGNTQPQLTLEALAFRLQPLLTWLPAGATAAASKDRT